MFLFIASLMRKVIVTVLKMKLSKLIKSRLQKHRRGANPVAAISEGADEIYFLFAWSE